MNFFAKNWILFILLCGFTMQVCAQEQTFSKQYGRLFNSTNQRQQLESQRAAPNRNMPIKKSVMLEQPVEAPVTKPVTLNGYVKRSDGKSTLWVNRQPVQENAVLDDIQIGKLNLQPETQHGRKTATQSEKLNIRIPANGQHIQLKAGQQFDPNKNQVKEITTVAKEKQLLLSESPDEMTEIE